MARVDELVFWSCCMSLGYRFARGTRGATRSSSRLRMRAANVPATCAAPRIADSAHISLRPKSDFDFDRRGGGENAVEPPADTNVPPWL